jgi:hypothetical protein
VNSPLRSDALILVRPLHVLKRVAPKDAVIATKVGLRDRTIASLLAVTNDAMCAAMPVRNEDLALNDLNAKRLQQLLPQAAAMTIHTGRNLMSGSGTTKQPRRNSLLPLWSHHTTMTTSETKKRTMLSSPLQASMLTLMATRNLILMASQRRSVVDDVAAVEDVAVVDEMNRAKQKNRPSLRIRAPAATLTMISAKSCSMKIRKISSAFPQAVWRLSDVWRRNHLLHRPADQNLLQKPMMKIPKSQQQKNLTIVHADADVEDEDVVVVEAAMDLAKRHHAASDLLLQLVDQLVTMMISKTTIWIPMLNW